MQLTKKPTLQAHNLRKPWRSNFVRSFLSCTLFVSCLSTSVIAIIPAQAEARSCAFDDPNKQWRCEYTKGQWYVPYGGDGERPTTLGDRKVTGEGVIYTRKGPFEKISCKESGRYNVYGGQCRWRQHVKKTVFYGNAETVELIQGKSTALLAMYDVLPEGVAVGFVISAIAYRNSPNWMVVNLVGGLATEIFLYRARNVLEYMISNKNLNTARRGMCYYTITDSQVTFTTHDKPAPGIFFGASPTSSARENERVESMKMQIGWYGQPYANQKHCKS